MNPARRLILMMGWLAAGVSFAEAHAFVDHASPAVGGKVHGSPTEIKIWFTEKLDPARSKVQLLDARGTELAQGPAKEGYLNPALLILPVPKLAAGTYTVTWKAVSQDSHTTQGNFTFEVVAP